MDNYLLECLLDLSFKNHFSLDMSSLQNKFLDNKLLEDSILSDEFKNFISKLSMEDFLNIQEYNRTDYIQFIFASLFKKDIPIEIITNFSALFFEYLECENKFFYRDKINTKLKTVLYQRFHYDIEKISFILQKIQYIIRNIEFNNLQFKMDLCRIERFFMNLILRRYTDNLVRGHRRLK